MPKIHYFDVPSRLGPFIECAFVADFTQSVGETWHTLPTGGFGVRLLTGPAEQDYQLMDSENDGLFSGIASHVMGGWCDRPCLVFNITLTPLGVLHLSLQSHDLDALYAVTKEAVFGCSRCRALRATVRKARSVPEKMRAFLSWMETVLIEESITYGRAASIAEAAQLMRGPRPLTILGAADRAGVARRQFERDFRRYLGTSPKRYETISRVQQMAQLSWQGLGLADIAAELSFVDQAHMSRVVKRVAGMSPAALLSLARDSEIARITRPFTGGRITHF
jgi:AraC-like DNA-binding protein